MDQQLLRAFVSVAETGSFTAAARALNRTQSAVSLQIKRLEEQVGDPLFHRTTRNVELTDIGGVLLPYAHRILNLQDEASAAVDAVTECDRLRFGIPDEQALAYLPGVIPDFRRTYPEVQLEVQCDLSTRLIDSFDEGDLDIALAVRHGPTSTGELLGEEETVWVAGNDFRNDGNSPLPLAVYPEGCVFRSSGLAALTGINRRWEIVYVSASPTGINVALQTGMAATIKAARSVPPGCRVLDGEPGIPPLPRVEVELHRSPLARSKVASEFVRLLIREIDAEDSTDVVPSAREML